MVQSPRPKTFQSSAKDYEIGLHVSLRKRDTLHANGLTASVLWYYKSEYGESRSGRKPFCKSVKVVFVHHLSVQTNQLRAIHFTQAV
jgi:hypothetical protein